MDELDKPMGQMARQDAEKCDRDFILDTLYYWYAVALLKDADIAVEFNNFINEVFNDVQNQTDG